MRKYMARVCLFLLFGVAPSAAAQLVLTNGDRLTGTVEEFDGDALHFNSELAGEVKVDWRSVTRLATDQPVYVTLRDGGLLVGRLTLQETGQAAVETADAGRVSLAREAIAGIRSQARYQAWQQELERLRSPGLGDLWSGSADAGLAMARGNSDTLNWNLALRAARATARDRLSAYFTQLFAESRADGETTTTASALRSGLRYDLNLTERVFTFVFTDFEVDRFQNLDLRNVIGGGLGFHMVNSARTRFDLFGGAAYNNEFFRDSTRRRSLEAVAGQELAHRVSDRFSVTESLVFFPNLSEAGDYRIQFDTAAETRLSRWLSWQVTLSDRFLSSPVGGARRNDLLLTTGVRVSFGAQR